MRKLQILTASEQVAAHLRQEILRGIWTGTMPGEDRLVARLGVGRDTLKTAVKLLEQEGWLVPQGKGRRRLIVLPESAATPQLRISILAYEKADRQSIHGEGLLHALQEEGHAVHFAEKDLHDLKMDPRRVARFVGDHPADAWVIIAGSSAVLQWFSEQPFPSFAIFGRSSGLNMAGASPRKSPAMIEGLRRLVELGHRRIVLLVREERRKPHPALAEAEFLEEMERLGLPTGPYNFPDWEDSKDGFLRCLDRLFEHTPPTALFIIEPKLYTAALQHLAQRGIAAPRDVSLVCDELAPSFEWCEPSVSHIRWKYAPLLRRVAKWASHVARGKPDTRLSYFSAKFIEGGSIGPVPKGK
ncbi:substrate-binding domain-containing protein [Haloferula sp. A504]|uniref:substrate-binding domain-containing protein n=1 Tax=Haloferula sp. A504 TaxID=3373601 RepID=UPI0031BCC36D|nr:substrate-binding domain-containing protein [Verrucomicrobiaceae bacterium E54]